MLDHSSLFSVIWNNFWSVTGAIIVIIIVTEFGVEAFRKLSRKIRGKSNQARDYRPNADTYKNKPWANLWFYEFTRQSKIVWAPYVQWQIEPLHLPHININEDGLRETVSTPTKTMSGPQLKIFAFGGSTLFGVGVRDKKTIPSILSRKLQDAGGNQAIINFGQLGHASTQELISFFQTLKNSSTPDVAIFYHGINDVISAEQAGQADRMINEQNRKDEFNLLHYTRRSDLIYEGVKAMVPRTLRRFRDIGIILGFAKEVPTEFTLLEEADIEPLSNKLIDIYINNIRNIEAIAREWGVEVLFFWQPSIFSKIVLTDHEAKYLSDGTAKPALRRPFFSGAYKYRKGHPYFQGRKNNIDISHVLDDVTDGCYIDPFHVSEEANEIIAEAMVPHVQEALIRASKKSNT